MTGKFDAAIDALLGERQAEAQLRAAKAAKEEQDRLEADRVAAARWKLVEARWTEYKAQQDACVAAVARRSEELAAKILANEQPTDTAQEYARRQWKIAFSDGSVFRTVTFVLFRDGNLATLIDNRAITSQDITTLDAEDYGSSLAWFAKTVLTPAPLQNLTFP